MEESASYQIGFLIGRAIGVGIAVAIPTAFVFCLVNALKKKARGWIVATVLLGLPFAALALFFFGCLLYGFYLGITK